MKTIKNISIISLILSIIILIVVLFYIGKKDASIGGFYSPDIVGLTETLSAITPTSVYSTTTLRMSDSGTTYLLSASGTTITLPAVSVKGTKFRFITNGNIDTGTSSITSAAGDDIEGSIIVAGVVSDCNAADAINFNPDYDNIGDYVDVVSTGTYWVITGGNFLTAASATCSG